LEYLNSRKWKGVAETAAVKIHDTPNACPTDVPLVAYSSFEQVVSDQGNNFEMFGWCYVTVSREKQQVITDMVVSLECNGAFPG